MSSQVPEPLRGNGSRFRILVPAFLVLLGVIYALAAYQYRLFPYEAAREPSRTAGERSLARKGQSAAHAALIVG